MARAPRVVAELGRPETPDETAARKAASSKAYRSSQTFRNLIVALAVTLAAVAVIVFAVPRGEYAVPDSVDAAAAAATAEESLGRDLVVPEAPEDWRVNGAELGEAGGASAWTLVYAPESSGYLRVSQGLDVDASWARSVLRGQSPDDTVVLEGVEWERYEISDASDAGNVSFALGAQAGADHVLLYGTLGQEATEQIARGLAPQIRALQEAAP